MIFSSHLSTNKRALERVVLVIVFVAACGGVVSEPVCAGTLLQDAPSRAQEAIAPVENQSTTTDQATAPANDVKNRISEVQKALQDLRANKSEDADRIAALEARLQLLRRIQDGWEKTKTLRDQCDMAAQKRAGLEKRLQAVKAGSPKSQVPANATDAQVRERVRTLSQSIDDTEAQNEFVVSSIDFRLRRRQELRELEAKNLKALADIDSDNDLSTIDRKLQLEQLQVEQELIEAERAMFKATDPNLTLSRKVLSLESEGLREQLTAWQGLMNTRIKASAKQLASNAAKAVENASHSIVRSQAEKNHELATRLEQIHIDESSTLDRLSSARVQLEDIRRQRMLDESRVVRDPTPEAVAQMRARFTGFPDVTKIASDIAAEQKLIQIARDQLDFLETLSWLSKPADGAKQAMEADQSLGADERSKRVTELEEIFEVRQEELIAPLRAALNDRIDTLSHLVALQQSVLAEIERYRRQVLDRTIWIRDPTATTAANYELAWEQLRDVFSPNDWHEALGLVVNRVVSRPVLALLGIGPLVLWAVFRWLIRRRIKLAGSRVADRSTDSIGETMVVTFFALLAGVAWAAPAFVAALFLSSQYNNTPLILSLHNSMMWVWKYLFILGFVWSALRAEGLAERHFLFSQSMVRRARWALVFALMLVPFGFFAAVCGPNELDYIPAGRLLFVPVPILIAVMVWLLFHPADGIFGLTTSASSTAARIWNWIFVGVFFGIFIFIAVIANLGWYRLILSFQQPLVQSMLLIGGMFLAREYLLRFLRARHVDVAAELRQEENDGKNVTQQVEEMRRVEARTLRAIRFSVVAGILFGLYLIWRTVFPAFAGFDQIVVWSDGSAVLPSSDVASTESQLIITLGDMLRCLVAIIISWYTARNLPSLIELVIIDRFKLERGISYAITQLLQWGLLIGGLVFSASFLEISWSSVQWLAAGLTVGLGFGLQEIFANFISGLIILFERPIRLGDVVTVGGTNGRVSRIRMRSTTISDWDRKELVVPNKKFITEEIVNWSIGDACIRLILPVGVSYQEDPTVVADILRKVSCADPEVLHNPSPTVIFERFGDNSLDFELRLYLASTENMSKIRTRVNMAIKKEFDAAGITIPFPQRDIRVEMVRPDAPDTGPSMPLPTRDDVATNESPDDTA